MGNTRFVFSRGQRVASRGKVRQGRKYFFSEEKKQKTFIPAPHGTMPAMASIVEAAEK
jgi:hypothetical protein